MASNEEKDTFVSFLKKYVDYRDYFNKELKYNVTDNIERFDTDAYYGRMLAVVVLMLVHNKYKGVSPNIINIKTYNLQKLQTVDIEMFEPYIAILRIGQKEKKAAGNVTPQQRHAKFVATFIRYLAVVRKLGITTTTGPEDV